jgi:hypothetical protein
MKKIVSSNIILVMYMLSMYICMSMYRYVITYVHEKEHTVYIELRKT